MPIQQRQEQLRASLRFGTIARSQLTTECAKPEASSRRAAEREIGSQPIGSSRHDRATLLPIHQPEASTAHEQVGRRNVAVGEATGMPEIIAGLYEERRHGIPKAPGPPPPWLSAQCSDVVPCLARLQLTNNSLRMRSFIGANGAGVRW
jgi:hypothetical protein